MDTTFSSRLFLLSNKLFNKFMIIKSFFHIENNTLYKKVLPFDLKSAIIRTIDLLSMSMHTNTHISLDFDPCLPDNIKGDKPKLQQILSALMELALQMTDEGEISLNANLEALFAEAQEYLICFQIAFTPTSPHSKVIISHLLFKSAQVNTKELKKDLSKRDLTSVDTAFKFKGIPHLQIGLVRDVVYKLVHFLEGRYKIISDKNKVIFEFTMPVEQGPIANSAIPYSEDRDLTVSPFRSIHNGGLIKYSKSSSENIKENLDHTILKKASKIEENDPNSTILNVQKPPKMKSRPKRDGMRKSKSNLSIFATDIRQMKSTDPLEIDENYNEVNTPVLDLSSNEKLSAKFGPDSDSQSKSNSRSHSRSNKLKVNENIVKFRKSSLNYGSVDRPSLFMKKKSIKDKFQQIRSPDFGGKQPPYSMYANIPGAEEYLSQSKSNNLPLMSQFQGDSKAPHETVIKYGSIYNINSYHMYGSQKKIDVKKITKIRKGSKDASSSNPMSIPSNMQLPPTDPKKIIFTKKFKSHGLYGPNSQFLQSSSKLNDILKARTSFHLFANNTENKISDCNKSDQCNSGPRVNLKSSNS